MPFTNIYQKTIIDGLRSGAITQVPLAGLVGLIGFPSVHAASSLLYIWAGWQMRPIRIPVTFGSMMMLISTPVEGAHYMIDIVAGLSIAVVAIAAAGAIARMAAPVSRSPLLVRYPNKMPRAPRRI
jgi:membrane-associated phospholipid phosphatase